LPGRATRAPDAQRPIAPLLLAIAGFLENSFLQESSCGDCEKAGFVDGEILEEQGQLVLTFPAGQQAIVTVKGIELASLEPAL